MVIFTTEREQADFECEKIKNFLKTGSLNYFIKSPDTQICNTGLFSKIKS